MTLTEFLAARLDEDERQAQAMEHFTVPDEPYYSCASSRTEPYGDLAWGEDACDCFLRPRKARALREVEAMRKILAMHTEAQGWSYPPGDGDEAVQEALEDAARALAAIWSDHPDYAEASDNAKIPGP